MTDAEREAYQREIAERDAKIVNQNTVISEMQRTFDLMWDADQRGIKAWQEANPGNDLVWPDRAKHMQWILNQIARLQAPQGAAATERATIIFDAHERRIMKDGQQHAMLNHREMLISDVAYAIEQAEARGAIKTAVRNFNSTEIEEAKAEARTKAIAEAAQWHTKLQEEYQQKAKAVSIDGDEGLHTYWMSLSEKHEAYANAIRALAKSSS